MKLSRSESMNQPRLLLWP